MKEMSDQTRVVIASALSLAVIVVWSLLYRPAAPPPGATNSPARQRNAAPAGAPAAGATERRGQPAGRHGRCCRRASAAAVGDTAEKTIVVESDLYRVVSFQSRRGGAKLAD